jgi:putative copper resistance protein D
MEKIMIPESWIYASWLVKVILYLGIAFVVGGTFSTSYLDVM